MSINCNTFLFVTILGGGHEKSGYDVDGGPVRCRYFSALFNIFATPTSVYILAVKLNGGSLHHRAKDPKSLCTLNQVRTWICQLVEAVQAMQIYGIAHRAIKLQHVMLKDNDVQVCHLVILI